MAVGVLIARALARCAGLEPAAEPRLVEAALGLFEALADRKRRPLPVCAGPYVNAVRAAGPQAFWPLDTLSGEVCADLSGNNHQARCEPGVAFFVEGPPLKETGHPDGICRAVHCAGGRIAATLPVPGDAYSVELWFWNGLPCDARAVTGYILSRGRDREPGAPGEHLSVAGQVDTDGTCLGAQLDLLVRRAERPGGEGLSPRFVIGHLPS